MKKLLLGLAFVIGLGLTSCKKDKDSVENVQPTQTQINKVQYSMVLNGMHATAFGYSCYINGNLADNFSTQKVFTGDKITVDVNDGFGNCADVTLQIWEGSQLKYNDKIVYGYGPQHGEYIVK